MNTSSPHQIVIIPVSLGEASNFNRVIFPLSSYRKRDSIGRGDLYLDATLDEVFKIIKIGANPDQLNELIDTTKAKYDRLLEKKSELEQLPKSVNPLRKWAKYRAARMFLAASKSLYNETKSRSAEIVSTVGRTLLSIPREDAQPVQDDIPPNTNLAGILCKLDRPLDDSTKQQVLYAANTFASFAASYEGDQGVSDTSSFLTADYVSASASLTSLVSTESTDTEDILDETPSSLPPTVVNHFNFYGPVYSPNSKVYGTTVQLDGSSNSGSVIHTTTHSNTA